MKKNLSMTIQWGHSKTRVLYVASLNIKLYLYVKSNKFAFVLFWVIAEIYVVIYDKPSHMLYLSVKFE